MYAVQKNAQGIHPRVAENDLHSVVSGSPLQAVDSSSSQAKIRQIYALSLDSMKSAHLKAFYQMKQEAAASSEGIPLTRSFSYFHPCAIKLTFIELCKKPLNIEELPEIFSGLEQESISLHQEYQRLPAKVKKQLFDELLDGDFSANLRFNQQLDSFVSRVESGVNSSEISPLMRVFDNDVYEAKEVIDFLTNAIHSEATMNHEGKKQSLTVDTLLIRALSSIVKTGELPEHQPRILNTFFSRVKALKDKYDSIDPLSRLLLDVELKNNRLGTRHAPKAEELLAEIETTIAEIKSNNRSLMPLLVYFAHQQVKTY